MTYDNKPITLEEFVRRLPNDPLAHAALIAAAPELLAALKSIVRRFEESERTSQLAWLMTEDAKAALKALV